MIGLLLTLAWTTTGDVDVRATTRVLLEQRRAGDYWQGLVASGLTHDSATQLALTALRTRLRGTAVRVEYPLLPEPRIDSLWQAMYLNPFRAPGAQTPRSQAEDDAIRTTQEDLRLIREVGHRTMRERIVRSDLQIWVGVIAASALLGGFALWRRVPRGVGLHR